MAGVSRYKAESAGEFVWELPADVLQMLRLQGMEPERITRCRDCKNASADGQRCYRWMTLDIFETPVPSAVNPSGFCAWGKTEEDA